MKNFELFIEWFILIFIIKNISYKSKALKAQYYYNTINHNCIHNTLILALMLKYTKTFISPESTQIKCNSWILNVNLLDLFLHLFQNSAK